MKRRNVLVAVVVAYLITWGGLFWLFANLGPPKP
jgi:hypothetical protein